MADLARAAGSASQGARAIFIAADEAAMRTLADAAGYFAPELNIIQFPAWDCLPSYRSSPSLRSSSERLAALSALQAKPTGERKGWEAGKGGSVRVDLGGVGIIKQNKKTY